MDSDFLQERQKKNQCDVISVTQQPTIITLGLELDDGC